MTARRFKIEFAAKAVEKSIRRPFPDSHRAIALHIAVPANRTKPRARFSNLPAQQHQVHDLLNVGHGIFVLSQAHGPTKDRALGFDKDLRGLFDLRLCETPDCSTISSHEAFLIAGGKFVKAGRVVVDELVIQYAGPSLFFFEHRLA